MSKIIEIITKRYKFKAKLNDSKTSKELIKILPVKSDINRWGDEIYFTIPLEEDLEDGKEVLEVGDIAFWPPGNAFCIFFGKTPASTDDKPRAAGPVTVLGRIKDKNLTPLKEVKSGEEIEIKLASVNNSKIL